MERGEGKGEKRGRMLIVYLYHTNFWTSRAEVRPWMCFINIPDDSGMGGFCHILKISTLVKIEEKDCEPWGFFCGIKENVLCSNRYTKPKKFEK